MKEPVIPASRLERVVEVLARQARSPETMAAFFTTVGARPIVLAMAQAAFGPPSDADDSQDALRDLPALVREGLQSASRWATFDAAAFVEDLAAQLNGEDPAQRDVVAAVIEYLFARGTYDLRLLDAMASALSKVELPDRHAAPKSVAGLLSDVDIAWSDPHGAVERARANLRAPARD